MDSTSRYPQDLGNCYRSYPHTHEDTLTVGHLALEAHLNGVNPFGLQLLYLE